jgi:hypothetical protein
MRGYFFYRNDKSLTVEYKNVKSEWKLSVEKTPTLPIKVREKS